jgi:uncharacterized protein (UPF0262 family)
MKAKLIKTGNNYLLKEYGYGETLAITSGTMEGRKLSLKNCEAIANGYDLVELACNEIRIDISVVKDIDAKRKKNSSPCIPLNEGGCVGSNLYNQVKGFEKGFQKALDLMSDKKFSINEVVELTKILISNPFEKCGKTYQELTDSYIQSLQQTTEIDVEIICMTSMGHEKSTNTGIPELDEDGCLILKQI